MEEEENPSHQKTFFLYISTTNKHILRVMNILTVLNILITFSSMTRRQGHERSHSITYQFMYT